MSFDYFAETNEKLFSLLKPIEKVDALIKTGKENLKKLKRDRGDKEEISKVKNENEKLENNRKQLWKTNWAEAYKLTPYFGSHWKLLSSAYFEERKPFNEFSRDRHIELQFGHGREKIKEDMTTAGLSKLLNSLKNPQIDLSILPFCSCFLQFTFTLATPYLSKDDEEFYIIDNPVRKDKVFKVPMIAGSSWKGNMRWTAHNFLNLEPNSTEVVRLFGNDKNQQDIFRRGRLNFYPTFFDQIGLEVINPHDRKTKAGTQPIYIESVPEGASGTFSLLYVPFDLMGKPEADVKIEVAKDLEVIHCGIREMMLTYGFSAKKSSGFGIVRNEISDLQIKPEIKNEETKINTVEKVEAKKQKKGMAPHEWTAMKKGNPEKEEEVNQVTFDTLEHRVGLMIAQLLKPSVSGGNNE